MSENKIQDLLKILDMPEEKQQMWLIYKQRIEPTESLADLAFNLNGGLIAGKRQIEWIINALIEKEKKLDNTPK